MKNIADQQKAQDKSNGKGSGDGDAGATQPNKNSGGNNNGDGSASAALPMQIHFSGPGIGTDPKSLARYLQRAMAGLLKDLHSRSREPILGR